MNILSHINWIDIVLIILLFRGGYIAVIRGFHIEIFKFFGVVSAALASLHYYSRLSIILQKRIFGIGNYADLSNLAAFLVLVLVPYGIFALLRILFCWLIKIEAVPNLDRWGGFVFGLGKSFLFSSLLVYMLAVTNMAYFKDMIRSSYISSRIFKIAPKLYSLSWKGLGSKLFPEGKMNSSVVELKDSIFKTE